MQNCGAEKWLGKEEEGGVALLLCWEMGGEHV